MTAGRPDRNIFSCDKPMRGRYGSEPTLMVFPKPSIREYLADAPLTSPPCALIGQLMRSLNLGDWGGVYAYPFPTPGKTEPTKREIKDNKEEIQSIIDSSPNLRRIVLFGQACGDLYGLTLHGPARELNGVVYCAVPMPDVLISTPDRFPAWLRQFKRAFRLQVRTEDSDFKHMVVNDPEFCAELLEALGGADGMVAIDLETTSLDPRTGEIVVASFKDSTDTAIIVPGEVLRSEPVLETLRRKAGQWEVCGSNFLDFDWRWFHVLGVDFPNVFDTLVAHHLCDENAHAHDLESLAEDYLGMVPWKSMVSWKKGTDWRTLVRYSAIDIHATYGTARMVVEDMEQEGVADLWRGFLRRAGLALVGMSEHGVLVDRDRILDTQRRFKDEIEETVESLRVSAGDPKFNPNSPKQVAELLFGQLGFPEVRGASTDRKVLEALSKAYPEEKILQDLIQLRELTKLEGTYMFSLLEKIGPDGRIRTHFKLAGTVTGRLSSADPNLQNIPKKIGPLIRDFFIPDPGLLIADIDYSQLELRVAAHLSGDPLLTEKLNSGEDLHRHVASMLYKVPFDEVTDLQRTRAKAGTFGVLYGMGVDGAMFNLGLNRREAEELVYGLRKVFSGLAEWAEEIRRKARTDQFIVTPFGRRRRFPLIVPKNEADVDKQSVNTMVQSTASDICLHALVRAWESRTPTRIPVITVHDSIVCLVGSKEEAEQIAGIMEDVPFDSKIRFKADVKIGDRWGSVE